LERLRAFFRFAQESAWVEKNPAKLIKRPRVKTPPTMPYTRDEVLAMLNACAGLQENYGGHGSASRLRAFTLLLRYSGLRITDAATCAVERLTGDKLFLYTQKTGVPVRVKLPQFVVEALQSMPRVSTEYFFWTGEGKKETAAGNWRRSLRKLFTLASIKGGH